MKIMAIETEFDGVIYRSRLEAQTALFFKTLRLNYLYEPRTVELPNKQLYVPDFWLPDMDTYIEVKGGHNERLDKWEAFTSLRERELDCQFGCNGRAFLIIETGIKNKSISLMRCQKCKKVYFLDTSSDDYICPCCKTETDPDDIEKSIDIDSVELSYMFMNCRNSSARYDKKVKL